MAFIGMYNAIKPNIWLKICMGAWVDRLIIAERLSAQRLITQPPLNLCLQVNIDGQDSKMAANLMRLLSW